MLAEIPDSEWPKWERFWAEPLGSDLYRLRNSPFHAYDLHFLDIVRAVPKEPDGLPVIIEVVERSGHKTLRVFFTDVASGEEIKEFLDSLDSKAVNYEGAQGRLYALDVRPEADYPAMCNWLWRNEQAGNLHYETVATQDDQ